MVGVPQLLWCRESKLVHLLCFCPRNKGIVAQAIWRLLVCESPLVLFEFFKMSLLLSHICSILLPVRCTFLFQPSLHSDIIVNLQTPMHELL